MLFVEGPCFGDSSEVVFVRALECLELFQLRPGITSKLVRSVVFFGALFNAEGSASAAALRRLRMDATNDSG